MPLAQPIRHAPAPARGGDPKERELVITRTFDAPRELVFRAWTEPERASR